MLRSPAMITMTAVKNRARGMTNAVQHELPRSMMFNVKWLIASSDNQYRENLDARNRVALTRIPPNQKRFSSLCTPYHFPCASDKVIVGVRWSVPSYF